MIEPSVLSWSVVIWIFLTGWLVSAYQDYDDSD
jgi:hypothetical protein